jgi:hypothetical protein
MKTSSAKSTSGKRYGTRRVLPMPPFQMRTPFYIEPELAEIFRELRHVVVRNTVFVPVNIDSDFFE